MALTTAQLQTLKAEVFGANPDPQGYGYAPFVTSGADNAVARLLNVPRDGSTPAPDNGIAGPAITVRRTDVLAREVLEQLDNRDLITNATNLEAALFESIMQQGSALRLVADDGSDTRILGDLRRLLQNPGPQGSRARVSDVANRPGSRAEQLLGRGVTVTDADVAAARAA